MHRRVEGSSIPSAISVSLCVLTRPARAAFDIIGAHNDERNAPHALGFNELLARQPSGIRHAILVTPSTAESQALSSTASPGYGLTGKRLARSRSASIWFSLNFTSSLPTFICTVFELTRERKTLVERSNFKYSA